MLPQVVFVCADPAAYLIVLFESFGIQGFNFKVVEELSPVGGSIFAEVPA